MRDYELILGNDQLSVPTIVIFFTPPIFSTSHPEAFLYFSDNIVNGRQQR